MDNVTSLVLLEINPEFSEFYHPGNRSCGLPVGVRSQASNHEPNYEPNVLRT
jgi:hypothetical protein